MKAIATLLVILGIIGGFLGLMMFGDIGIAAIIGALAALLSGIGFFILYFACHIFPFSFFLWFGKTQNLAHLSHPGYQGNGFRYTSSGS